MRQGKILLAQQAVDVATTATGITRLDDGREVSSDVVQWLPPVSGTVFGVALNDTGQRAAWNSRFYDAPYKTPPKTPVLFVKPANTHTGHNTAVALPEDGSPIQSGGALGVVIGQRARHITAENAGQVIAGYTIVNELSLPEDSVYRPAIKAKCRDGFCPIGPLVTPAAAITNPHGLEVRTYVNGELSGIANTHDFLRPIGELIAFISSFITLNPGDLIICGPAAPRIDLAAGDTVAIEIDGLGRLENHIVASPFATTGETA